MSVTIQILITFIFCFSISLVKAQGPWQPSPNCSGFSSSSFIPAIDQWREVASWELKRDHTVSPLLHPTNSTPLSLIFGGVDRLVTSSQTSITSNNNVYSYNLLDSSLTTTLPTTSFDGEPVSRFGHIAWTWQSSLYIFGGFGQTHLNDIWRFDVVAFTGTSTTNSTWRPMITTGVTPGVFYGGTADVIHESNSVIKIIKFGGVGSSNIVIGTALILIASDSTTFGACDVSSIPASSACSDYTGARADTIGTWTTLNIAAGAAPPARGYHASVSPVGSLCVYIFGGIDILLGTFYGDLWSLCPVSVTDGAAVTSTTQFVWTEISGSYNQTAFIPVPRYGHVMHELTPGRLLIHGGSGAWPNQFIQTGAEYDIIMNLWIPIQLGSTPVATRWHASMTYEDTLVIVGGVTANGIIDSVYTTNYTSSKCGVGNALIYCEENLALVCQVCANGTQAGDFSYECVGCVSGEYAPFLMMEGCTGCEAGKYGDGSTYSTSETHCLPCSAGKSSTSTSAPSELSCTNCLGGTFSQLSSATCSTCLGGTYSEDEAEVCIACDPGFFSGDNANVCTGCPGGSYQDDASATTCKNCLAGTYSDPSATICLACPPGRFSTSPNGSGPSSCTACPAGEYNFDSGQTTCVQCAQGKSSSSTAAIAETTCETCTAGTFSLPGHSTCTSCPPGSYQEAPLSATCDLCALGKYSAATQAVSSNTCIDCAVGTFTGAEGSDDVGDCRGCPAGQYSLQGSGDGCFDCPRGRYTADTTMAQQFSCALCPINSFAPNTGQSTCQTCPSSSFSHHGYEECISCTADLTARMATVTYTGSLSGFYPNDEISVWDIDSSLHTFVNLNAGVGPLSASPTSVLQADANNGAHPVYTATLDFFRFTPLLIRGYVRVLNLDTAIVNPSDFSIILSLSNDGTTFTEALAIPITPVNTAWFYIEQTFHPTTEQIARNAKIEMRFSVEDGDAYAQWAGIGMYNAPFMSCGCGVGEYFNLETPGAKSCEPQPSCRESEADCYRCSAGFWCATGALEPCPPLEYSFGGSTACSPCPDGWLCENGLALPCATEDNLVETADNTVCSSCPEGHECLGGEAVVCEVGTYSIGGPTQSGKQCLNCPPGKHQSTPGQASCDDCPPGTTANFGKGSCLNCKRNEISSEGEFPCASCASGYISSPGDTECVLEV